MVPAPDASPTTAVDRPLILLTGASGYVGGRLLELLEAEGARLRCMTRRPEELEGRVAPGTEVLRGDVMDAGSLDTALAGVDVAYYLVHSMASGTDYRGADRRGAATFARAARSAAVGRIVYLGGSATATICRPTWPAARRSGAPWRRRGCRHWSCGRRSSSDRAARRSR